MSAGIVTKTVLKGVILGEEPQAVKERSLYGGNQLQKNRPWGFTDELFC